MIPVLSRSSSRRRAPAAGGGGGSYLNLTGASGSNATTPDSVALSIAGDLDIRVKIAAADYTPAAPMALIGQWGDTGGEQSWCLFIMGDGTLLWAWNDSSVQTAFSTASTGLTDGSTKWIRVTHDVNNGASGSDICFYLSDDGSTWTQLGSTITVSGVASHIDRSTVFEIGANDQGSSNFFTGKIYSAQVLNGISGTVVASPDFTSQASGTTSFADAQGNTWTINSPASIP